MLSSLATAAVKTDVDACASVSLSQTYLAISIKDVDTWLLASGMQILSNPSEVYYYDDERVSRASGLHTITHSALMAVTLTLFRGMSQ